MPPVHAPKILYVLNLGEYISAVLGSLTPKNNIKYVSKPWSAMMFENDQTFYLNMLNKP